VAGEGVGGTGETTDNAVGVGANVATLVLAGMEEAAIAGAAVAGTTVAGAGVAVSASNGVGTIIATCVPLPLVGVIVTAVPPLSKRVPANAPSVSNASSTPMPARGIAQRVRGCAGGRKGGGTGLPEERACITGAGVTCSHAVAATGKATVASVMS